MIKNKIFNVVILLLLLINTGIVTFLLLNKKKQQTQLPHPQQGGAFRFLVKELKLDSVQIKNYEVLRDKHKNSVDSIKNATRELKDSLFNLIKTNSSSDEIVQQKLNKIAAAQKEIDAITFNHFKQVRLICNVTQQQKFDEIIAQALKMTAPQMHHRPPPRKENERPEDGDEHFPPPHSKEEN